MTLYIGRLPAFIRDSDLEDLFKKYGKIAHCNLKVWLVGLWSKGMQTCLRSSCCHICGQEDQVTVCKQWRSMDPFIKKQELTRVWLSFISIWIYRI